MKNSRYAAVLLAITFGSLRSNTALGQFAPDSAPSTEQPAGVSAPAETPRQVTLRALQRVRKLDSLKGFVEENDCSIGSPDLEVLPADFQTPEKCREYYLDTFSDPKKIVKFFQIEARLSVLLANYRNVPGKPAPDIATLTASTENQLEQKFGKLHEILDQVKFEVIDETINGDMALVRVRYSGGYESGEFPVFARLSEGKWRIIVSPSATAAVGNSS